MDGLSISRFNRLGGLKATGLAYQGRRAVSEHISRASREDADQFTFVFALVERRRRARDVGRRLRDPS
jgi:hypothetical protein